MAYDGGLLSFLFVTSSHLSTIRDKIGTYVLVERMEWVVLNAARSREYQMAGDVFTWTCEIAEGIWSKEQEEEDAWSGRATARTHATHHK